MVDLPPVHAADTVIVTGRAITPAAGLEAFGLLRRAEADLVPASGRIEDALRDIGGIQLFRRSSSRTANPTAEGVTARGLAGNAASRMLVTLDGVPLADPFFGFVAWGALAGREIASAEIVRGGGSSSWGPGALAGTVGLISSNGARAALRLGSRASLDGEGAATLPVASGNLAFGGGFGRGDGHRLVADHLAGPADVPARYRRFALFANAETSVGDAATLRAGLSTFDDRRLRGIAGADIRARGTTASLALHHAQAWTVDALLFTRLADFSTVTRSLDATRSLATTVLDQTATPAEGLGARLALSPPLGDRMALQFGVDAGRSSGETQELFRFLSGSPTRARSAGGRQQTGGLFVDGSARLGDTLLLTAAARLDHWQLDRGHLREIDLADGAPVAERRDPPRDGTETTARLGLAWRPVAAVRLRAAAYQGWRLPTLNELYRPFRAGADATASNPALRPERLVGGEVAASWQPLAAIDLGLTAYWNRLSAPIVNVTIAQGPGVFPEVGFVGAGGSYRQRRNLDRIDSRGLEADAKLAYGSTTLLASAALIDARVRGGGLDGLRPAQAPHFAASATLRHQGQRMQAQMTLRHLGATWEDDLNRRRLPPATTLDAGLGLPLGPVLLRLEVENLADTFVQTGFSGALPERGQPRTVWLGLEWRPPRR